MKNMNCCSIIILLFLFALMSVNAARASQSVKTVLNNGLTVIIKENHAAPVVSLHVYVRAGSIYEREFLGKGISHYLEHLVHSGTEKRTREQMDQIMEEIGNVSNAYTSKDHASYYITTASSYFDIALDPNKQCVSDFGVMAMPTSYLIDRKGVIRHVHQGFRAGEAEKLRLAIEYLLTEPL